MSIKRHMCKIFVSCQCLLFNLILMLVSVKPVKHDQEQVRSSGVGSKIEKATSKLHKVNVIHSVNALAVVVI